ncbi:MAG: glycosyltransferase family 39 protein [Chloroflexota bacterium]
MRLIPRTRDAAWVTPALALVLAGTGVLYLWGLDASGWANAYYSAAAQAGSENWLAMLFGALDAGNAISIDKTPASVWVMALSVRMFGMSSWSVLAPQALMGVGSVWLLYLTVRRSFGPIAGLVAGTFLALTPVAVLMFRFNNPDALLVLLLVGSVYATTRALETASTRWLVAAGVAVGLAFLTKMLQGFLIVPALAGVYLVAAPTTLRRRLWQVAAAGVAVLVSAGWYIALVELLPPDARPYVGGSQTNSLIELMLGYNGLGRLSGDEIGRVGGGGGFGAGAGLLRLFQGETATEASWLLPAALVALGGLLLWRRGTPRTDMARAHVLLWGGWLVGTGLVFSLMQGIFHEYYTVALAPAIAALVGIGAGTAWRRRSQAGSLIVAAATVGVSAVWAAVLLWNSPSWMPWLAWAVIAAGTFAVAALLLAIVDFRRATRRIALLASLGALLLGPGVASVATAAEPHTGAIPTAAPRAETGAGQFGGGGGFGFGGNDGGAFSPPGRGFGGGFGGGGGGLGGLLDAGAADPELIDLLETDADGFRWAAATTGANNAAGLALSSGTSVLSIGGFNGTDPYPTLAQFQAYVADGAIHYYVAGGDASGFRGASGGSDVAAQIAEWVNTTFPAMTVGGVAVYDLTTPLG